MVQKLWENKNKSNFKKVIITKIFSSLHSKNNYNSIFIVLDSKCQISCFIVHRHLVFIFVLVVKCHFILNNNCLFKVYMYCQDHPDQTGLLNLYFYNFSNSIFSLLCFWIIYCTSFQFPFCLNSRRDSSIMTWMSTSCILKPNS